MTIIIKKFNKISRLVVVIITLYEDNIAYLFCVCQPVKNKSKENTPDKIDINIKLYSISKKFKLGPQIILIQNK